jgi:hypothetical protein
VEKDFGLYPRFGTTCRRTKAVAASLDKLALMLYERCSIACAGSRRLMNDKTLRLDESNAGICFWVAFWACQVWWYQSAAGS